MELKWVTWEYIASWQNFHAMMAEVYQNDIVEGRRFFDPTYETFIEKIRCGTLYIIGGCEIWQ